MTARLIAYDPIADLALLEPSSNFSITPVQSTKSTSSLVIGQTVIIYGYPMIGGETITRTEWKIAGYQSPVYKIDASIDHGNSGGWAFDNLGNLIGIPYAVSSDNGVIGYMVSQEMIDDFLQGKTPGYETVNTPVDVRFLANLARDHRQMQQYRQIKWSGLEMTVPQNSRFTLTDSAFDENNELSTWYFKDSYGRVSLSLSCTLDASTQFGYDWDAQTLEGLSNESQKYNYTGMTTGKRGQFYRIRTVPITPKNNASQAYVDTWYYKNYDACYAQVYSTNLTQDAKMITQAEKLLQSAKFRSNYKLVKYQKNPYFALTDIPEGVRSIFSIDTDGSKSVTLDFLIEPTRSIHAKFWGDTYSSQKEYFTKPFYAVDSYSGVVSFDALLQQFSKNIENTQTKLLLSKNGKRMIFSYLINADTDEATVNVTYPYILDSQYYVWYWSKTFAHARMRHIDQIRSFFSLIDLPGREAFL